MFVCMYVCMCIYIYIYIYTHNIIYTNKYIIIASAPRMLCASPRFSAPGFRSAIEALEGAATLSRGKLRESQGGGVASNKCLIGFTLDAVRAQTLTLADVQTLFLGDPLSSPWTSSLRPLRCRGPRLLRPLAQLPRRRSKVHPKRSKQHTNKQCKQTNQTKQNNTHIISRPSQ